MEAKAVQSRLGIGHIALGSKDGGLYKCYSCRTGFFLRGLLKDASLILPEGRRAGGFCHWSVLARGLVPFSLFLVFISGVPY